MNNIKQSFYDDKFVKSKNKLEISDVDMTKRHEDILERLDLGTPQDGTRELLAKEIAQFKNSSILKTYMNMFNKFTEIINIIRQIGIKKLDDDASIKLFVQESSDHFVPYIGVTTLDYKLLFRAYKNDNDICKFMLKVFNKSFDTLLVITKGISTPNFDTSEFSRIITNLIGEFRTLVPRCDEAFDIIIGASTTIDDSMNDYYLELQQTSNPLSMLTSVIDGVMKSNSETTSNTKSSKLFSQMARIKTFLAKKISSKNLSKEKSAAIDPLMKMINNIYDKMAPVDKTDVGDGNTGDGNGDIDMGDIDLNSVTEQLGDIMKNLQ